MACLGFLGQLNVAAFAGLCMTYVLLHGLPAEYEPLVKQTGGAAVSADLRKIPIKLVMMMTKYQDLCEESLLLYLAYAQTWNVTYAGCIKVQDTSVLKPRAHISSGLIFGATDEDVERLRIVSLFDVDLEKAFGMQVSLEGQHVWSTNGTFTTCVCTACCLM
eukprot:1161001-Pelagomonas_calceolata.AAC.14